MFHRLAALALTSMLAFAAAAKADEPQTVTWSIPADSSKALPTDRPSSKAAFDNATPAVRVALCGVEADAGNTGLDAGLIDFNVPDPARAAGHATDDRQGGGGNVPDYRASVFLGITLGYHF